MERSNNNEAAKRELFRQIHARYPRFFEAVIADARLLLALRQERFEFRSRLDGILQVLRLCWTADAFLALVLYRAQARLTALGVPLLPKLLHHLAMSNGQVSIGEPVVVEAGVRLLHGMIVIDGVTEIHSGVQIAPFVTIGRRGAAINGPIVESNVLIGTGAKLIGPIRVGEGASIGANAVVLSDVPPGATVVGAPARPTSASSEAVST
jgi:serine O-acetyltransferase